MRVSVRAGNVAVCLQVFYAFVAGVNAEDLKVIVEFMYRGRVQVLETLGRSAKSLGCVSLVQLLTGARAAPGTLLEDPAHAARFLEAFRRFYTEAKFTDVSINCQVLRSVSEIDRNSKSARNRTGALRLVSAQTDCLGG